MSMPYGDFFRNTHGYDPAWYDGYDPAWLLGRQLSPPTPAREKADNDGVIKLKVPFCCEGCVEKVYKKLKDVDGVTSVHCDLQKQKVTVHGIVKPEKVLKHVKKVKQMSDIWKKR